MLVHLLRVLKVQHLTRRHAGLKHAHLLRAGQHLLRHPGRHPRARPHLLHHHHLPIGHLHDVVRRHLHAAGLRAGRHHAHVHLGGHGLLVQAAGGMRLAVLHRLAAVLLLHHLLPLGHASLVRRFSAGDCVRAHHRLLPIFLVVGHALQVDAVFLHARGALGEDDREGGIRCGGGGA